MEKSVMSLAGGSLVMVGVMRSSVPVTFTVTSYGPLSVSDEPNPETVPSIVTSKNGSMRNGFWNAMVPRVTR